MMHMCSRRHLAAIAVGLCVFGGASLALAPAALAAQWNGVAGTVYSDGSWYTSSVNRHVTTPNDTIKAYCTGLPGGGLVWRILKTDNVTQIGSTRYYTATNYTQVFASGVLSGTVFHNSTREYYAHNSPYNWEAQEWY